jgi:hypothetical protein
MVALGNDGQATASLLDSNAYYLQPLLIRELIELAAISGKAHSPDSAGNGKFYEAPKTRCIDLFPVVKRHNGNHSANVHEFA